MYVCNYVPTSHPYFVMIFVFFIFSLPDFSSFSSLCTLPPPPPHYSSSSPCCLTCPTRHTLMPESCSKPSLPSPPSLLTL